MLPKPAEPGIDSDHNNELRDALRSMAEWHFEHPDQPHPMSGKTLHPDSGGLSPEVSRLAILPRARLRPNQSESTRHGSRGAADHRATPLVSSS